MSDTEPTNNNAICDEAIAPSPIDGQSILGQFVLSDDNRETIIRQAISTVEGWKNLARSVKYHSTLSVDVAKQACVALLRKVAGDKEADQITTDGDMVSVPFADLLVVQLEKHISEV
jgi:hypothetical protein